MAQPSRRAGDLVAGAALVLLAGGIWLESTRWPTAADFAGNPVLVPRALAVLMVTVALALAWRALRGQAGTAGGSAGDVELGATSRSDVGRVAWTVAATLVLGALLEPLGVPLAAFAYLVVLQRLTGSPMLRACLVAALVSMLIWGVFRMGLNVPLPSGTLWG